jgi:hypothetical protein
MAGDDNGLQAPARPRKDTLPGPGWGPATQGARDIPEGERSQMPLPQVNERIKEVPAQALRAVFAGIGQVLLVADKIRNRAVEQVSGTTTTTTTTTATAPAREAPPAAASSTAPAEPQSEPDSARRRSPDETGNVSLISKGGETAEPAASALPTPDSTESGSIAPPAERSPADQASAEQAPADQASAEQAPADQLPEVTQTPATPAVSAAPAPQAPAAPEATKATEPGALPLSNYDELTIASLRARLRVLSPSQISILLEYEKATEGRPAVITMFERRLAKLEQEGS